MRTGFFRTFATLPQEFRNDLEVLWKIPHAIRMALLPNFVAYAMADSVGESDSKLAEALQKVKGKHDVAEIIRAFKVVAFIIHQWDPSLESPTEYVRDFRDLGLMPEAQEEAELFFAGLFRVLQKNEPQTLREKYADAVLPSYVGVTTLVDMRMVYREPYGSKQEMTIDKYKSKCVDYVPVVIVQVERDSGDRTVFRFQCTENDVKIMIEGLQAALRDCAAAKAVMKEAKLRFEE